MLLLACTSLCLCVCSWHVCCTRILACSQQLTLLFYSETEWTLARRQLVTVVYWYSLLSISGLPQIACGAANVTRHVCCFCSFTPDVFLCSSGVTSIAPHGLCILLATSIHTLLQTQCSHYVTSSLFLTVMVWRHDYTLPLACYLHLSWLSSTLLLALHVVLATSKLSAIGSRHNVRSCYGHKTSYVEK